MRKIFWILSFIFILSTAVFSQSTTPPVTDFQIWNDTTVTIPLWKTKDAKGKETERISMFFEGVLRFGRNLSQAVDERIGGGFEFRIYKYLLFTPSYLYVAQQPFQGRRDFEHRLRLAATLEKKFKKFSIRDRNLIEIRFRNFREDSTRYRNKFQFNYPVYKDGKELFTPFAADEVYYDFLEKEWTRNDVSVGITKKFNKNLAADFFYLFRNTQGSALEYTNAFGVNLKFKID